MKVRHCEGSDVGRVRERNEDSLFAEPPLFAVADGMGGHEAGEVASSVAVRTLARSATPADADSVAAWLADLVRQANVAVYEAGSARGNLLRMGTTITVAYTADDALYLAHVGDSRGYLVHEGRLRQVTDDHSLVAEWVREGRLSAEEASVHPQRSVITRALGMDPNVAVDAYRVVPTAGDRVLLCSDGLTGPVSDHALEDILCGEADPCDAVRRLIETANANGGEDNITVVVIDILEEPDATPTSKATGAASPASQADFPEPTVDATGAPAVVPVAPGPPGPLPYESQGDGGPGAPVDSALQTLAPVGISVHAPPAAPPEPRAEPKRRRGVRIVVAIAAVAVVAAAVWFGARALIFDAYYVGVSDGNVAIFKGAPRGTLGVDTSSLVQRYGVLTSNLPQNWQNEVKTGIRADSRQDAERIVASLQAQVVTTTTTTTTVPPATPPATPPQQATLPAPPGEPAPTAASAPSAQPPSTP